MENKNVAWSCILWLGEIFFFFALLLLFCCFFFNREDNYQRETLFRFRVSSSPFHWQLSRERFCRVRSYKFHLRLLVNWLKELKRERERSSFSPTKTKLTELAIKCIMRLVENKWVSQLCFRFFFFSLKLGIVHIYNPVQTGKPGFTSVTVTFRVCERERETSDPRDHKQTIN